MNLNEKRLALHYHIEATIKDGYVYYPAYYGRWIDSLSKYFKKIVLITHTIKQNDANSYKVESKNLFIIDLGAKPSPQKRILNYKKYQNILKKNLSEFDIICYRVPSPLARFFYKITKNKINFFLLVGHMVNATSKDSKATWKSLIWKYYWKYDHSRISEIANDNLTLVNGPTFLEEFPNIANQKVIFTSTIWDKEIVYNRKVDLDTPIKLLYLGRISSEKKIDILINAFLQLSKKYNVELNIAGNGDLQLEKNLKNLVISLELQNIYFLGHIASKEKIQNLMDTHDIFIVPSEWDWQPRTIWEAMSRGMPIVCSKGVKSPYILFKGTDVIDFFEINDEEDLSSKISNLIIDYKKRESMIRGSLRIAKERTLEKSAELLVKHLDEYINEK